MPSNYSPVNTFHSTITVPIDGDAPNASSVSTPVEQVADNVWWTVNNYLPLTGGTVTGVVALASGGQIQDQNAGSFPGLECLVQAAAGHKKKIAQWSLGPSIGGHTIFGRIYSSGDGSSVSQIETTINAIWDDTAQTWGQDDTALACTRKLLLTTGEITQAYLGSTGWIDSAWVTRSETQTGPANSTGLFVYGAGSGKGAVFTGGATGTGGVFNGGATSGSGAIAAALGGNSYGLEAYSNGSSPAVYAIGGATGDGGYFQGGGGNANGALGQGLGVGSGFQGTGGSGGGIGVYGLGGGTNGIGIAGIGSSGGYGGLFTGNSGGDGVHATSSGVAVRGTSSGSSAGVLGVSTTGPGVLASANAVGPGIEGNTAQAGSPGVAANSSAAAAAFYATGTGSGVAVAGDTTGGTGVAGYFNGNGVAGTIGLAPLPWNGSLSATLPSGGSPGQVVAITSSGGVISFWVQLNTSGGSGIRGWYAISTVP